MSTTRRLAAILAADVAGYSRLMAADEIGTLEALKSCRREIVDPAIAEHNGRMVKTTGDGLLVEFASAVDAVTCAMAVQEKMAKRTGEPHIAFRLGINVGDIIIDADDIFGDGVNVAARVENECEPGAVYLSDDAFRQVRGKLPFDFADLGERPLKNIDRPIRIYAATGKQTADVASFSGVNKPPPLPDRSSIAVLPFQNLSGDPEQEYFADGMRLARLAAEFGSDDPEALAAAAYAFTGFDSLEAATVMLDRATKLNPNLARAWSLDGFAWLYLGDHARSLSSIHRALRLNPTDVRSPMLMGGIATIHFLRGEFDQAVNWAEKGLRESPTNMFSLRAMAMSAVKLGDGARAAAAASKLVELYPKCLARIRKMMKRPEHVDAIADALHLAGFRE
jgi:class 3 adenylate cyclase